MCVALLRVRVHVFLEYLATDALKYSRAPDPARGRGDTPRWGLMADGGVCRLLYDVYQTLSLWSLRSDSPTSSQPQPLGSVGDDTPCEDTREDVGLSV